MSEVIGDKEHAVRSPSGAKKRKLCAGSVVLEEGLPRGANRYSAEGTAAHGLMELCLTNKQEAEAYEGRVLEADGFTFVVDEEMIEHVNSFLAYVYGLMIPGDTLLVEQAVPVGQISGEEDATGTADVIILSPSRSLLIVVDLKYGRGVGVNAESLVEDELTGDTTIIRNEQLMYYAAGAVEQNELVFDFDHIQACIHQPRREHISETELTLTELNEVDIPHLREIEARCDNAVSDREIMAPSMWQETYLHPGEEQCRFCKAKGTCPALRGEVLDSVFGEGAAEVTDFDDLTEALPTDTQPVGKLMKLVPLIEVFISGIRAEAERLLFAGEPVEGFKLVAGKKGNRAWKDEVEAETTMRAARLKVDQIFKQKLVSPAAAEKLLKKDKPRVWKKLQECITQSDGQPSVAPEDDKRPPLDLTATAEDFADLGEDDGSDLI